MQSDNLNATELAARRTSLAAERTLMAWIRTALSMISFGFTIFKFLGGLHEAGTIRLRRPEAPRDIGLFLAALGTGSLVAALFQHVALARELGRSPWQTGPAPYVSLAVVLLGLLVLFGLIARTGPF